MKLDAAWTSLALLAVMTGAGCGDDGSAEGTTGTSAETPDSDSVSPTTESGESSASGDGDGDGDPATGDGDGEASTGDGDGEASTGDGDGDEDSGGVKFDVDEDIDAGGTGMGPSCEVVEGELDAIPPCEEGAPADSFEPEVQWEWFGEGLHVNAITTPLVANLTDDNEDGSIDLCDTPDIVVMTHDGLNNAPERLWVLDGATGSVHWDLDLGLSFSQVPALGDVDGDGELEIVAVTAANELVIVSHEGLVELQQPVAQASSFRPALGLADFDNDGEVEIFMGNRILDAQGNQVMWASNEPLNFYHASAAADLDGDGDLELIVGRSAFHHDGSVYYQANQISASHAQVGDLDEDGEPEVLLSGANGLSLIEHDGSVTFVHQTPGGDPPVNNNWRRPAAIHDFTADGTAEFSVSSANNYNVIEGDFSLIWAAPVADLTGAAGGTAFDFLGDGSAEAIYGDEDSLFVFDEGGQVVLQVPRLSRTTTEYPVVADVDNDGSAELVVVSESDLPGNSATVQVIRDAQDRWVPARRIWNQHTYHVTNVREDGVVPQNELPHWDYLNTFRTQAQAEDGVCLPEPVG